MNLNQDAPQPPVTAITDTLAVAAQRLGVAAERYIEARHEWRLAKEGFANARSATFDMISATDEEQDKAVTNYPVASIGSRG